MICLLQIAAYSLHHQSSGSRCYGTDLLTWQHKDNRQRLSVNQRSVSLTVRWLQYKETNEVLFHVYALYRTTSLHGLTDLYLTCTHAKLQKSRDVNLKIHWQSQTCPLTMNDANDTEVMAITRQLPQTIIHTVEPPIKDLPRKGQPPNKGHTSGPHSHSSSSFLTSEKRTTSQQRTKLLVPKCPLFGGSTVYSKIQANLSYGHFLKPWTTG